MQEIVVVLNFEIFTVHAIGDDDVMCFNSMNESTLRVIVSGRYDISNNSERIWTTSRALSFTISLKQASTELQNAIRTAARMNIVLDKLITESNRIYEQYELSGKKNKRLLAKHEELEGQADMLAADIVILEEDTIIPSLNSIGVHIEEFDNDKIGIDLSVYYTDEHGISCNKRDRN